MVTLLMLVQINEHHIIAPQLTELYPIISLSLSEEKLDMSEC